MPTLAVITLPVLAPIAALLQLLFPGLLAEQWRNYKIAIGVLLTQSSVFMLHWATVTFWVTDRVWWLSDLSLTIAIVIVAAVGLLLSVMSATAKRREAKPFSPPSTGGKVEVQSGAHEVGDDTAQTTATLPPFDPLVALLADITRDPVVALRRITPSKVEYFALGIFALLGVTWFAYQFLAAGAPWDPVVPVTVACLIGIAHLLCRGRRAQRLALVQMREASARVAPRTLIVSTELVFLFALTLSGAAMAVYVNQAPPANQDAGAVVHDWPTYRGNERRTGAADATPGPRKPVILWTFDPAERKGRVMIHSTPTVVNDRIFVGALHQVLTSSQGYVYCINALDSSLESAKDMVADGTDGALSSDTLPNFNPGDLIWRFSADGSAKAVFTSPTVAGGKLYFGEGYHEDLNCRLFCVDARTGKIDWALPTTSHTESTPTVLAGRVYFGAGDDGVYCVDAAKSESAVEGNSPHPRPRVVWHRANLHVDTAPAVADGRVFISTVIGEVHAELKIVALDSDAGDILWQRDTPLPVPGSPSHHAGRVYFGLGNGKLGAPAEKPAGAVWCVDAKTGDRLWEFKTGAGVFGSPVLHNGNVIFGCLDHHVYCLDEMTGDLKWRADVSDAVIAPLVVTYEDVFLVTASGLIKCIDTRDGNERWTMNELKTPDADAYAGPTLAGGRLYVAIRGKVHCIGDE